MTAEQLIDKCYCEIKPYPYAKIWRLYAGTDYSSLNREMRKFWRWAVKDKAEYGHPLPSPNSFDKRIRL